MSDTAKKTAAAKADEVERDWRGNPRGKRPLPASALKKAAEPRPRGDRTKAAR